LSRASTFVGASPPLAFSLIRVSVTVRRLAGVLGDTRVQLPIGLLALAVLTFVGVLRVPVFVDEADNVLSACLLSRGELVYRDYFSHHFPLPYYVLAAFGESAACSVLAGRVVGVLTLTLAAGVFAWTARNAWAPLALLVMALAAPAYYLQLYLAETFISAGLILALALLTDRGRRLRGPVGFGLRLVALTVLSASSPLGLMMAGLLMPVIVLGSGRPYTTTVAACAGALLVWPAALAIQGLLPAFVEQAILFNTQVYSKYLDVQLTNPLALLWETLTFFRHRFSFVTDWVIGQEAKATVASFAAGFELLLLVLLGVLMAVRRDEKVFRLGVVLLVPLAVARDGFHLGPFVALACFGCVQLAPSIVARRGRVQLLVGLIAVAALRIYFFALPVEPAEGNELARSLEPDVQVRKSSAPGDAILYLPIAPQGYLADDRRPGSFYTSFLPWMAEQPGGEDRIIADIEQNRVATIVLDQETLIWDSYRLSTYAPRLYSYIMTAYRPYDGNDRRKARVFVRVAP
jgi:uncharacterized membrane protein YbaN (DUF454 family)